MEDGRKGSFAAESADPGFLSLLFLGLKTLHYATGMVDIDGWIWDFLFLISDLMLDGGLVMNGVQMAA